MLRRQLRFRRFDAGSLSTIMSNKLNAPELNAVHAHARRVNAHTCRRYNNKRTNKQKGHPNAHRKAADNGVPRSCLVLRRGHNEKSQRRRLECRLEENPAPASSRRQRLGHAGTCKSTERSGTLPGAPGQQQYDEW